MERKTQRTT